MTNKLTIVTGNTTKYTEMATALGHFGIQTDRLNLDIDEVKDLDAEHVIRKKAVDAFEHAQRPILVDDSGIYFDGYKNFPGTYSKFAHSALGYEGLFKLVAEGHKAVFKTFVGYMDGHQKEPTIFSGQYSGTITSQFNWKTESEMPYAVMFVPDGSGIQMASMTPEQRSGDHRHQALRAFADWYLTHQ